jgi:hypothetical protein
MIVWTIDFTPEIFDRVMLEYYTDSISDAMEIVYARYDYYCNKTLSVIKFKDMSLWTEFKLRST